MRILITILFISLTCEALIDILGPFGFLVFGMAALFFSCLAEKKKGGMKNAINLRQEHIHDISKEHII